MGYRGHHNLYSCLYYIPGTRYTTDRTGVGTFVCAYEIGPVVLLPDSRLAEWEMKTSEVRTV